MKAHTEYLWFSTKNRRDFINITAQVRFVPWFVYIVRCKDSKLYTGITNNLERRIKAHNRGAGSKFTKYRKPVKLLYSEQCSTKPEALSREARIKDLPRKKKLALIKEN